MGAWQAKKNAASRAVAGALHDDRVAFHVSFTPNPDPA